MVEFAFALGAKLTAINKHSFNDFKLRVGRSGLGPGRGGSEGQATTGALTSLARGDREP